ncbi:MAG: GNAT family N-acetyltransferase [Anaerolineae bacterium]|nr:GNAT family N-acetyltransferase [Anaerolineae bacterium]
MLRKMQVSDIDQVVMIHLSSFPGFFLTFLGPRFLKLLYTYMVSSPEGVGYIYVNDKDEIVGFVCGSLQSSGFYEKFFRSQWFHVSVTLLEIIAHHPTVFSRIVWRALSPPQASVKPGNATLMSIAVHNEYQRKGIGRELVQEFLKGVQQFNIQKVNLTTDRDKNEHVNTFYQNLGFDIARSFMTPEGRWMNEYVIKL